MCTYAFAFTCQPRTLHSRLRPIVASPEIALI